MSLCPVLMAPENLLLVLIVVLGALLILLTLATQLRSFSASCLHRPVSCKRPQRALATSGAGGGRKTTIIIQKRKRENGPIVQEIPFQENHSRSKHLHTPCSKCGTVNAKRDCSYLCCATCCRGNSESVCRVHGMGYLVAERNVESAILYGLYQCDISYSNLSVCPPGLVNIGQQLVTLNLSNNRLKYLPDNISQLSGLQELFLQYNQLSVLPASICYLRALVELDVKNNQLAYLPESLCKLKKLVVLNLTNNVLVKLPSRIGDMVSLQEISLHCNKLKRLPRSFCRLTNLQMLYAGENRLTLLPDEFGRLARLEELDVSGCQLAALPESFSLCQALVHVWLTGNKLVTLPYGIGELQRLSELHIRNNSIKFLPSSIVKLHLYTFTAQHNCFLEESVSKLAPCFGSDPPPLLELSARAVYHLKLLPSPNAIPLHLTRVLEHPLFCSTCGGPAFSHHYLIKFTFATVCVCYRLPIYHMYCSKNCYQKTLK